MSSQGTAKRGRSSNYEYVIARVRSRRASLFDDDDYRKLVRMGTGEIARFMEETEYESEMNALGSRYSGVDLVEYALNRNLAKHFDDLLRWSEGALYDYIARYLRKFDVWNVKTVIRGLYADSDATEVEDDLIRAGEFSERRIDQLLNAGSIEEVVEQLDDTIFGDSLAEAYEVYEESNVLVPLENAVDRAFYEMMLDGLPDNPEIDSPTGLYVEFLEAEVDFRNLRNALRLARSGADIDPSEYYIEGGKLFDEQSLAQLASNFDGLVAAVRESTYGDDLDQALGALEDAENLIEFERALDAALLEYADRLSNRYPLSVCPVLSYILAKEREVDNIRAIARGREAGLEPDEIEQELVIL
ncbi:MULTISPECIES: V-type ATP synthase subunit C [Haloarcula]|uniref:A-type ATP synthase subunit C n=1 Tax=Haloarcula pellucida TaxID=1427151 RepID=A0A830GIL3_9EURY|nr:MULTISPECIES: V-type ATP synthase subunit C [Halomicroarcula]MBX0348831.1 V-type ATP synthase subunit C [Halomicroarcula pellucida]MDS0278594.1 V-type ATP synthase subunit C [Halomicroarcula sp. S1AR25-4]GGN91624.1 ATP synthase subunit C [Halomicroarcula pellucida]